MRYEGGGVREVGLRGEGGELRDYGGGILDPELTDSKDRVTKKLEPNLT